MTKYTIYKQDFFDDLIVLIGENLTFIPKCEDNSEYQNYLLWLEEGNTPEPWNENIIGDN
jgi:hypothetical protein